MPTESIAVLAVIVAAFIGYAVTLAWTDYWSSKVPREPAE